MPSQMPSISPPHESYHQHAHDNLKSETPGYPWLRQQFTRIDFAELQEQHDKEQNGQQACDTLGKLVTLLG